MHDYDFNDSVDSWYCGKKIAYNFCSEFEGDDCSTASNGNSGAGTARAPSMGNGDELTTLLIWPYDGAKQGAIIVFRDNDCSNSTGRFYANTDPNMYAEYTKSELERHNIENDEIDSVMVPYGYSVDLYEDDNW